jgi:hypothetical protein
MALPALRRRAMRNGSLRAIGIMILMVILMSFSAFAIPPREGDFDKCAGVDRSDLAVFAADFGRTDCPLPH